MILWQWQGLHPGNFQPNSREKRFLLAKMGGFFVVVRLQLLGRDWSCLVLSCLRWFTRLIASIWKDWTCPTCFLKKGWHHFRDYVCLILSVTCEWREGLLDCSIAPKREAALWRNTAFLKKGTRSKADFDETFDNITSRNLRANSGLVWESWLPPMKKNIVFWGLSLWTHQWNVVFFWESVSSHSWPFRRIQAFLLAALKNNVNLRALHDAARIFLFGRKISIGIGRVVCLLKRDVNVRQSDDIYFFSVDDPWRKGGENAKKIYKFLLLVPPDDSIAMGDFCSQKAGVWNC